MDHVIEIPDSSTEDIEASGDLARYTLAARIPQGGNLKLVKFLAYGWSSRRSSPALRDQVEAALATAKLAGWDRLVREQREVLDQHWDEADVEIEGDEELQQAVRVGMFHVLQAGLRGERQPIPAKGLTGPRCWASGVPRSRGGPSVARRRLATGRRGRPPSTSTPTSPTP